MIKDFIQGAILLAAFAIAELIWPADEMIGH